MSNEDQMIEEMFNLEGDLTERQKKILAAAIESFAEKGFSATSTKEIAQKAGVAEGTIFRHYKTKKDLLLSIVTPMMIKLMAPIIIKDINKVLNHDHEKFEDFVRAMIDNRRKFLENNMKIIKIFIQEIPFHPELIEQFIEHVGMKVFMRFRHLIEHYQKKGQIIKLPSDTVLRLTGSTIIGYFVTRYAILPTADWDDEAEIESTIQFLMKGLAPE
jgi:AcrR family transcriptional regulator